MIRRGWRNEGWRHSLAAKGVKTNYFAGKSNLVSQIPKNVVVDGVGTLKPGFDFRNPNAGFKPDEANKGNKKGKRDRADKTFTPGTIRKNERDQRLLEQDRIAAEKKRSKGQKMIDAVAQGDTSVLTRKRSGFKQFFSDAKADLSEGDVKRVFTDLNADLLRGVSKADMLSSADKTALQVEANARAIELAQAGLKIPPEVRALLTRVTKNQIDAIEKQQIEAGMGAVARATRDIARAGLASAEDEIRRSEGDVRLDVASEAQAIERGITGSDASYQMAANREKDRAQQFPFADFDNVFLGDGDMSLGKDSDNGRLNFFPSSLRNEPTSGLSNAIVPKEKFRGPDFGVGVRPKTYGDRISDQVESFWSVRGELGTVDKSPLQKGNDAFKRGDREALISAINQQEFQIKQQESRYRLVDQTRQQVESSANRQSIFDNVDSSPFSFSMFDSGGGKKIADETRKINEVKKYIKEGADEARARAATLRGNLKRMDATVPFVESVPDKKVRVFDEKKDFSFADLIKQRGVIDERE